MTPLPATQKLKLVFKSLKCYIFSLIVVRERFTAYVADTRITP